MKKLSLTISVLILSALYSFSELKAEADPLEVNKEENVTESGAGEDLHKSNPKEEEIAEEEIQYPPVNYSNTNVSMVSEFKETTKKYRKPYRKKIIWGSVWAGVGFTFFISSIVVAAKGLEGALGALLGGFAFTSLGGVYYAIYLPDTLRLRNQIKTLPEVDEKTGQFVSKARKQNYSSSMVFTVTPILSPTYLGSTVALRF